MFPPYLPSKLQCVIKASIIKLLTAFISVLALDVLHLRPNTHFS